jgi:hypothetical protein
MSQTADTRLLALAHTFTKMYINAPDHTVIQERYVTRIMEVYISL